MICVINDITIPATDILSSVKSEEKLSFDGRLVVASSYDVEIDNTKPSDYDPMAPGSLFYGMNLQGRPAVIYDDDGVELWSGRVNEVEGKPGSLTLRFSDPIMELLEAVCVYSNDSDITPAEHIYNIIIDTGMTDDDLILSGFTSCIAAQESVGLYVQCVFTKDQGVKCGSVIEELARIGCMSFTPYNGRISVTMIESWDGSTGYIIKAKHVIQNSYKFKTDKTRIVNDYSIKFLSGGTVAIVTGNDSASIARYGTKTMTIPGEDVDSADPDEYRILIKTAAGARWVGEQYLALFSEEIYMVAFDLDDSRGVWSFLKVNETVALAFESYVNEPARITSIKRDDAKGVINVGVDLLNVPGEVYDRDIAPPDAPDIVGAYRVSEDVKRVIWEPSTASDLIGYLVYFTCSPGNWETEWCRAGKSPLRAIVPATDADGNCYLDIRGFTDEQTVYFKVKAFDSSLNESEFSDTAVCYGFTTTNLNMYRTTVNYAGHIVISATNAEGGTSPSDYIQWGTKDYAWYTNNSRKWQHGATYESGVYYTEDFSLFTWEASGNVYIRFAESDDGVTFPAWSSAVSAETTRSRVLTKKYLRFQINITDSTYAGSSKFRFVSLT